MGLKGINVEHGISSIKYNEHWFQTGRKSGGAEWEFETYLVKFETYSVLRDYETKKTTGAPAPASLAPMYFHYLIKVFDSKNYLLLLPTYLCYQQKCK